MYGSFHLESLGGCKMFFKKFIKENPTQGLSEKIKNDLIFTFRRKGFYFKDIKVDFDFDDMILKVFIEKLL